MKRYAFLVILSLFFVSGQSREIMAAPYYEGKVIKIVVGYKPGGGYDRTARLVGKHLAKHIPGKPAVIIENMEGAASMIAANYVYNIAKPDGLTIGTFNAALPFSQLTKQAGVKFDILKYAWLGSAAIESTVFVVRADLPHKTVHDLIKAKGSLMVGAMGPADHSAQFPAMLKEYAGLNIKLIMYQSSADAMLAIERKEVDGRVGSYSAFKPFIDRGVVRPFIRGRVATKETEDLPVNEDLTNEKKGKAVMQMLSITDIIGRPFVCPPGTPAEAMTILTNAFVKMSTDPELKADALKIGTDYQYTPGKEILKIIQNVFNQPPDIIAEFSKHVKS